MMVVGSGEWEWREPRAVRHRVIRAIRPRERHPESTIALRHAATKVDRVIG